MVVCTGHLHCRFSCSVLSALCLLTESTQSKDRCSPRPPAPSPHLTLIYFLVNICLAQESHLDIFCIYTYSLGDLLQFHVFKRYPYNHNAIIYSLRPNFLLHLELHIPYLISTRYFNLNISK